MFFEPKFKDKIQYRSNGDFSVLTALANGELTLLTKSIDSYHQLCVFLKDEAGIQVGKLRRGNVMCIESEAEPDYCYNIAFQDSADMQKILRALHKCENFKGFIKADEVRQSASRFSAFELDTAPADPNELRPDFF